jgi:hypothetical protein
MRRPRIDFILRYNNAPMREAYVSELSLLV